MSLLIPLTYGMSPIAALTMLVALKFSVLEYFLLSLFGLTVIASLAGDSVIKGLFSGILGLLLGCIGLDAISGHPRMTLGILNLEDGINFVPALIGLFSVSQVMTLAWDVYHGKKGSVVEDEENLRHGRPLPPWSEMKTLIPTTVRCSIVGTIVGIIPAAGAGVSSWICYSMGKKFSKHPEKFGHGALESVASCETGNNAATGGQVVFPGDILVGDKDGIVVIHRQDAEEVAKAAQEKKAKGDKLFETMKADWQAYAQKHIQTTQKRMAGKDITILEEQYAQAYQE